MPRKENIPRVNIPVYNPVQSLCCAKYILRSDLCIVGIIQGVQYLQFQVHAKIHRQLSRVAQPGSLDKRKQAAAGTIFLKHIKTSVDTSRLVQPHDIGMIQLRGNVHLALEFLYFQILDRRPVQHDLECHMPARSKLFHQPDRAERTLSEFPQRPISLQAED